MGVGMAGVDMSASMGDIAIGDLHADNTKQILVELEIAPAGTADGVPPPRDIAEAALVYRKPDAAHGAGAAHGDSSEQTIITAALRMAFTNNRAELGEESGDVAAAHMIQTTATIDNKVMALVDSGKVDDAIAMKETSICDMVRLADKLVQAPDHADGAAVMLGRVVERARGTVSSMKEDKDSRTVSMGMRCEQRLQRRMSVCALREACDSDDGQWSEDEDAVDYSSMRQLFRSGSMSPPLQRYRSISPPLQRGQQRRRLQRTGSVSSVSSVSSIATSTMSSEDDDTSAAPPPYAASAAAAKPQSPKATTSTAVPTALASLSSACSNGSSEPE